MAVTPERDFIGSQPCSFTVRSLNASLKRRAPRLRFFVLLLTLVSGVAVAVGFGLTKSRTKVTADGRVSAAPEMPLQIRPLVQPLFAKDSDEAVCIRRMLQ